MKLFPFILTLLRLLRESTREQINVVRIGVERCQDDPTLLVDLFGPLGHGGDGLQADQFAGRVVAADAVVATPLDVGGHEVARC